MIDIKSVEKAALEKIEEDLKSDRQSKLRMHKSHFETYKKSKAAYDEAKIEAEKRLPHELEIIEQSIRYQVSYGYDTTVYYVKPNNAVESFLAIMIFGVLTLEGYICKFQNEGKLEIKWA